jgi:orotate phosphoribosyltransferase
VVVIEDLISTGKSSLAVVQALRAAGLQIAGLVSIFNYGFDEAGRAFSAEGIKTKSLMIIQPDRTGCRKGFGKCSAIGNTC